MRRIRYPNLHLQGILRDGTRQIGIANLCERVISEHRVEGLRDLGTARLVDTAGIYPGPLVAVSLGELAEATDFDSDKGARILARSIAPPVNLLYILEGLLSGIPDMREDGIAFPHRLRGRELVEPQCVSIEEPHLKLKWNR